ncbi:hypothetical protein BDV25DRAFT_17854 [Aspergillus avenaceus]|uniref:Uncharacterized protein n=1 Tax=Aspergillus avenaceus TaxID=36643 RepID=A0A5N6U502_ASPAV|nr:hypothetical protein BDV25DRAFT_17854 [Aspergillus avenaceus]
MLSTAVSVARPEWRNKERMTTLHLHRQLATTYFPRTTVGNQLRATTVDLQRERGCDTNRDLTCARHSLLFWDFHRPHYRHCKFTMSFHTPPDTPRQSFATALPPSSLIAMHQERLGTESPKGQRSSPLPVQPTHIPTNYVEDEFEDRVRLFGSSLTRDVRRLNLILQRNRHSAIEAIDWQAQLSQLTGDLQASNAERDALRVALEECQKRADRNEDSAHQAETLHEQLAERQDEIYYLNKQIELQAAMLSQKESSLQKQTKASQIKEMKEKTQLEQALDNAKRRAIEAEKRAIAAETERVEAQQKVEETRKKLQTARSKRLVVEEQRKALEEKVKDLKEELAKKKEKKRRRFW